jgi:hypothetical protein
MHTENLSQSFIDLPKTISSKKIDRKKKNIIEFAHTHKTFAKHKSYLVNFSNLDCSGEIRARLFWPHSDCIRFFLCPQKIPV